MAGAIYRAEFLVIEDKSKDPHTDLADPEKGKEKSKETKTDDIIEKADKTGKELKVAAKSAVGVAIAVSSFVYNYSVNEQLTSLSIQGDSIAARNLQNQKTITNELLSVGGALAVGAIFPASLLVTVPALAFKYINKGIDYGNQQRLYQANVEIDRYISQQEQAKIQLNSREFR